MYDADDHEASPYTTHTLFAAAPTREYAPTGNVALLLPRDLYVEYRATPASAQLRLQSRAVNFGDGRGYVAAPWNQPLWASYRTRGIKRIKVRFTYTYQRAASSSLKSAALVSYESQFDLVVAAPASRTASTPVADDSVQFTAQPGQAAGKAYIHYGAHHTSLVKPFIVAEGYDRSHIAPHTAKNYSITQFLADIQTKPGFDFRNALDNVGDYDIVFIDYANGTDDIYLNAGLFEAVLKWVNDHKDPVAHQPNVVMGMSMGGLIARYKLAEMTKAGRPTQTRLLILQDSPQRGANIPLGISALIRQAQFSLGSYTTGTIDVTLQEANALLDQPATRQLLLYQTVLNSQITH